MKQSNRKCLSCRWTLYARSNIQSSWRAEMALPTGFRWNTTNNTDWTAADLVSRWSQRRQNLKCRQTKTINHKNSNNKKITIWFCTYCIRSIVALKNRGHKLDWFDGCCWNGRKSHVHTSPSSYIYADAHRIGHSFLTFYFIRSQKNR